MLDVARLEQQVSVVIEALSKKALEFDSNLDVFLQQQTHHDRALRDELQQEKTSVQQLKTNSEATQQTIHELESERQRLERLEQDLQVKIPHLQQSLQETQLEVQRLKQTLHDAKTNLSERERKMQLSCQEMKAKVEKYGSALGLDFKRQGNYIQFTFKKLLASDPERTYMIGLTLVDESTYKVVSCEPMVPCLCHLESDLIQNNNLKQFMVSLRKAFQSYGEYLS